MDKLLTIQNNSSDEIWNRNLEHIYIYKCDIWSDVYAYLKATIMESVTFLCLNVTYIWFL